MYKLKEFLERNNFIYTYIWYYLNELGKKIPINEYNSLDKDKCIKKMKKNEISGKPWSYKKKDKRIYLNDKEYNSLVLCYSIYLKHIEDVYVLDIDEEGIMRLEDLPILEYNLLKGCHYTVGNTKGIHIYIRIKDMVKYKNQQKVLKSMDGDLIKKNNIWENVNKEIHGGHENLVIKEYKWEEISMIFDKNKMNIENNDIFSMSTKVLYIDNKKEQDNISEISDITDRNNDNKIELGLFKKYLDGLSNKRSEEYLYWTQTIWIIYNVSKANSWSLKVMHEMIHDFSKRSLKYDEIITDNFIENNIKENGRLGVGTLVKWYKEDNNVNKIDGVEKTIDYSERGMGQLFIEIKKDILIYQDEIMYIYYKNEWHSDEKCVICKYIITETLIDYLINEKRKIDIKLNNILKYNYDEDKIKMLKEKHTDIIYYIKKLKTIKFIGEIVKQIQTIVSAELKRVVFDLGEDQKYNIHFKNGVYDIKRKEFRERNSKDYITQYLDYDYIEYERIDEEIHSGVNDFFKKIQPNEKERIFTLSYLAYSITGNTGEQVFKVNIGYSASNGKSTEVKIHERSFPIYTSKLNKDTFNKNNTKKHKYINKCLHNPIRLVYIEELDKSLLDGDFLKDWVDGNKISNEILYGTSEEKEIQAKLMTFSNKDFKIEGDEGICRRGKVQFYESKFEENIEDDYKNHRYKKIVNFESNFERDEYKNAYFHLLLKYIDKLEIPKGAEKNFKDIVYENDNLKSEIEEIFIITKDEEDKVSKRKKPRFLSNFLF